MTSGYVVVMRAYPKVYRAEHGDELIDTANELTDGWSFRHSRSLLVEGLRTRARMATGREPRAAWASAIAFVLGVSFISSLGFQVAALFGIGGTFVPEPAGIELLLLSLIHI